MLFKWSVSLVKASLKVTKARVSVFSLLLSLLLPQATYASAQMDFRCFSVADGLSSSLVFAHTFDQDGFLWVATADGLNRYDGYDFTAVRNQQTSAANNLRSVNVDASGQLWGGGATLSQFQPALKKIRTYDVSVGEYISAVYEDAFGDIWIAGSRIGFAKLNKQQPPQTAFYTKDNRALESNTINAITGDSKGNLWLATNTGLALYDAQQDSIKYFKPSAYSSMAGADNVRDVLLDSSGQLYAATAAGLFLYNPANGDWQHYVHRRNDTSSLVSNDLWSVYEASNGDIWLGTDKRGAVRFVPKLQRFQHFPAGTASYLLPAGPVFDISEDISGSIWLSIFNHGVCRLNPNGKMLTTYRHFPEQKDSLSFNAVLAMHEDSKGRIWIATDGGGLNHFDPSSGTFKHYQHRAGDQMSLSSDSVVGIAEDAAGILWLSTWGGGLNRFDPETERFTSFQLESNGGDGLDGNQIFYVGFDAQQRLWLSIWNKGLFLFDTSSQQFVSYASDARGTAFSVPNIHINTVHFSADGDMWIGGHDGVSHVDADTLAVQAIRLGDQNEIYDIYETQNGTLWFATVEGLVRYDVHSKRQQWFGEAQGFASDFIVGIEADDRGDLWLATRGGLIRFNPTTFTVENFGLGDGIQSLEFNRYAHLKTQDGHLYFGGTSGFNVFHPEKLPRSSYARPVYISAVSVLGQPIAASAYKASKGAEASTKRLMLAPEENDIGFEFVGLDYAAAEDIKYRYRLLGYERNWQFSDAGKRQVRYTNLSSGAYLFEVQASKHDGSWQSNGAALELHIAVPWWEQRKIQAVLIAMLLAAVYLVVRMRSTVLLRRQWRLESVIEAKSNELNVALAELELSNTLLESKVKERTLEYQQEIAVRRNAEKTLSHRASHDALTGLPNRTWLTTHLTRRLEQWRKAAGKPFALLFLDGDQFKLVNDSIGHWVGDRLLVAVAKRLQDTLAEGVHISRQGGDEFVVLIDEVDSLEQVEAVAQTLLDAMMEPFYVEGRELYFNVSIGVVISADYYNRPQDILRDADIAMYRAKANGKACYAIFDSAMHEEAETELRIINGLKQAVEKQQLYLLYQPIVNLDDDLSLAGFESLMRWNWDDNPPVGPHIFIPIAENNGLIAELGEWSLIEAAAQYKRWDNPPSFLGVNVSAKQLANTRICEQMEQLLAEHLIPSSAIKLEITETALMENAAQAGEILAMLDERGIQLAIDDFGAGYSSLSYLHAFPVQHLKIDMSFIKKIDVDEGAREIVKTIITLAHGLNMKTIAEGVDSQAKLEVLRSLGCDLGQGYLFAKPMSAEDAQVWLNGKR